MTTRTLSIIALTLWVLTIFALAFMFVRGQTVTATDGRKAVVLGAAERDLVLMEMRGMLGAVRGVVAGLAQNDMNKVAAAARSAGMAAAVDVSPQLLAKLPLEFKQLGMGTHKGLDELAAAAEKGAGRDEVLNGLEAQLASCVACHATYSIQAEKE
jgi:hypothetical protein